jgi:TetR/AcrR family transcriptional regulator
MGIAERKEREKTRRRKMILNAAKKIIARSGVEGISMDQVAAAAELNKATLYLYFQNKDDLIDAIVCEGLTLLEKIFQKTDQTSASGLEKVLYFHKTMLAFYKQYPIYFFTMNHQERRSVHARSETPFSKMGNEISARIFEHLARGLRQGIEEGIIRKEIDISVSMILMFAHLYGVMHTLFAKEDVYKDVLHLDFSKIEKSAVDIVDQYLRKR